MFQFLFLFIILSLILILLSPGSKITLSGKKGYQAYFMCFFLLFFLAAFRAPIVGNDTGEYIRIYNLNEDMIRNGSRYELGYLYFNYILYSISSDARLLLVLSSLLIFSIYGFVIWKYSYRPKLALLLFFLLLFGTSINTIRQSMAICILFFNIDNIVNRRLSRFIIITVLAALFHTTAIIFIATYPLSFIKINIKSILIAILISMVGLFLFSDIMNLGLTYFNMYDSYTEGKYFEGETRVASMVKVGLSLLFFFFSYFMLRLNRNEKWKNSVECKKYYLFLLMELLALMINILSLKVNLLDRLSLYFTAMTPILLSNAICLMPIRIKKLATITILLVLITYNCVVINYRPDWNRVYPIQLSLET